VAWWLMLCRGTGTCWIGFEYTNDGDAGGESLVRLHALWVGGGGGQGQGACAVRGSSRKSKHTSSDDFSVTGFGQVRI
jgi:hypothetical protein